MSATPADVLVAVAIPPNVVQLTLDADVVITSDRGGHVDAASVEIAITPDRLGLELVSVQRYLARLAAEPAMNHGELAARVARDVARATQAVAVRVTETFVLDEGLQQVVRATDRGAPRRPRPAR